ncbi:MAG: hypothetical protein IPF72_10455 [Chitinophagaceae bacterium]|nr:hypothetical protein [Chitinophagaceae bacterium]
MTFASTGKRMQPLQKDNRLELNNTLKTITEQSQNALKEINKTLEDKVAALIEKIDANNKANREELNKKHYRFLRSQYSATRKDQ